MEPFTFIIRASGENTVEALKNQVEKQISKNDTLLVLNSAISFEKKLKNGFEEALRINNNFSVFIDGDILLRSCAIMRIRKVANKLPTSDFGFGLLLWDKFQDKPIFRGLHIYRTRVLKEAILLIPGEGEQVRPETYVKKRIIESGSQWRNHLTHYVAGLHDYFQNSNDIYYKFLIRSKRSIKDIQQLKSFFILNSKDSDFQIALQGISDGEKEEKVINNKFLYLDKTILAGNKNNFMISYNSYLVDIFLIKKLMKRYSLRRSFWSSL